MLRLLWAFLLVLMNICGDHWLGKHQKKQLLKLIAATFLASSSKKPKAKALLMFEQTIYCTTCGVKTPLYFLLTHTMTLESIAHAQLADSSRRSFASKSSNSSGSSSSRTGTSMHPQSSSNSGISEHSPHFASACDSSSDE